MTVLDNLAIPSLQLHRAYLLARAHGHIWSHFVTLVDLKNPLGLSVADIKDIVLERSGSQFSSKSAALAPTIDEFGNIVHFTTTRRLKWEISPIGKVDLGVFRLVCLANDEPRQEVKVMSAEVFQGIEDIDVIMPTHTHKRHIALLRDVLRILVGWREAFHMCEYYHERALPDQPKEEGASDV